MSGNLLPGDQAYHDDKQLLADLTGLNGQLSRYVLRLLDADAKRAQPPSVAEERAFARELRTMANRLEERADQRAAPDTLPALEGDATLRRSTSGRPSQRC